MNHHPQAAILSRLDIPDVTPLGGRRAAFLGCGDSLAAARPAEQLGHRVLSAGDVAWGGGAPQGVDVVVPLSWSGKTGATIRAAQIAKDAGLPVIAVTTNAASPLAELADDVVIVPAFDHTEDIPAVGYAVHSAAVAALVGDRIDLVQVASDWANAHGGIGRLYSASGPKPRGMTIATTADAHGAGEFWMLKLIEATGLTARTTGVEEVGHVDYFLGPQQHLALMLAGDAVSERATALGDALARNGQQVVQVRLAEYTTLTGWSRQVLGGVIGADYSAVLATGWDRPFFRGGQVDMSARHIQVPVG
ncbi:SIS domain-containing protein [Pseudactinotalea sp. HY160]|uniref:SIS domain-containing protein n=1 Tax=Pseudactinotalea sp. HY160 TaxID=2654490 RepID=UPI00128DE623|nr:SIS domain-containing protein [Pseudactinotalea sp. HY160]MPV50676.1 SIS domain-containing protein [Pseudactinotalea sp. HY160]